MLFDILEKATFATPVLIELKKSALSIIKYGHVLDTV